jgi:hypothetical protein
LKALHKRSGFPGEEKEALAYRKDAVTIGSIQTDAGATRRTWFCLTGAADPSAQTNALAFQGHADGLTHRA